MRFLIDEQLPPALGVQLRRLGHVAEHVRDIGLGGATDAKIRNYASRSRAVLITKDEDFAAAGPNAKFPIVWIRLGNVTSKALWRALEPVLPEIISAIEEGERLIEIE